MLCRLIKIKISLSIVLMLIFVSSVFAIEEQMKPVNPKDIKVEPPSMQKFDEAADKENLEATFPEEFWWEDFNDPILTSYIKSALDNNYDLKSAFLVIEESRELVRESFGNELPVLGINPAYTRQKNSKNLTTPQLESFMGTGPKLFSPGSSVNIFNMPLNASYEADFWLKNRNITKAKKVQYESTKQTFKTLLVLISTEVANAYFNLIKADKLVQLQQEEIALYKDQLDIIKSQNEAGLVSDIEVVDVQNALVEAEATLPKYQLLQDLFAHQLSVLMGQSTANSKSIERASIDQLNIPEKVKTGLPSELISRRPDVIAKELELQKARIEVSLARKAFLPSVMLSGSYGYGTTKLKQLFNWESMMTYFTSSIAQTLLAGGSRRAALRARKFKYEQKLYAYYQSVLTAFQDVEDGIASFNRHSEENGMSLTRIKLVNDNIDMQDCKYDQGLIPYIDVLKYKIQKVELEKSQLANKTDCLTDILSIYKALGGGY
ncbi:MAG: efflux transporter outer membrane subunit [Vampirovibrionia bacterium]